MDEFCVRRCRRSCICDPCNQDWALIELNSLKSVGSEDEKSERTGDCRVIHAGGFYVGFDLEDIRNSYPIPDRVH
jgi:hypothetical protein